MDGGEADRQGARRDTGAKLPRALHASDVMPMLHRLARKAPEGSEESLFAHGQLAELVAERNPWRASLHARKVLRHRPEDDRAWATLALCLTMMGHYRYAVTAYRNALTAAPSNPWYAHNLGHLLDVALERAEEAIPWLTLAQKAAPWSVEMAASCAHALARCGRLAEAKRMATRAQKTRASRELAALLKWIEAGAPEEGHLTVAKGTPFAARGVGELEKAAQGAAALDARRRRAPRRTPDAPLLRALRRGLTNLPLAERQRERALEMARDAVRDNGAELEGRDERSMGSLAAALAYAVVYVDRVPLTQADVAACFRVSVSSLRGRFGALRTRLALTPGDVRWRTLEQP